MTAPSSYLPLTGETALNLLARAVQLRGPQFRYKDRFADHDECVYAADGEACCLIGVALILYGVPVERLEGTSGTPASLHDYLPFLRLDDDAIRVLTAAQAVQDDDKPWGEALAAAAAARYARAS